MQLEAFSGPLDLLLHLVRKNEIDIYDIPMARLTEQYLEYLEAMPVCDLALGGEFLVMAATLMEIKSRLLLPSESTREGEEEGPDPRAALVQMLEEYQRYQQAAVALGEWLEKGLQVFPRGGALSADVAALLSEGRFSNLSVRALVEALQGVLRQAEAEPSFTAVRREPVSVRQKLTALWRRLLGSPNGLRFRDLFTPPYTRAEVVATFLAMLELLRRNRIRVFQEHPFGELHLIRT